MTFEQRFGSDLRVNLHFHLLALDGVFSESGAVPLFYEVGAPTEEELNDLAKKIHRKIAKFLRREGWVDDDGQWESWESPEEIPLALELAAVSVPAEDRAGLERLCKYISRPPIATDRLELTNEGKVRYTFRKAWRNGRTYVELEPLEFIARLVPLIPRPRLHLIHFHGVLAPRSRLRPLIVPRKEPEEAQGF